MNNNSKAQVKEQHPKKKLKIDITKEQVMYLLLADVLYALALNLFYVGNKIAAGGFAQDNQCEDDHCGLQAAGSGPLLFILILLIIDPVLSQSLPVQHDEGSGKKGHPYTSEESEKRSSQCLYTHDPQFGNDLFICAYPGTHGEYQKINCRIRDQAYRFAEVPLKHFIRQYVEHHHDAHIFDHGNQRLSPLIKNLYDHFIQKHYNKKGGTPCLRDIISFHMHRMKDLYKGKQFS